MNFELQDNDLSLFDVLNGYTGVSGSSIICSSDVEVIEVRSVSDFISHYVPLSSTSLCIMILAFFFYKKFLDLIKVVINSMLKEASKRYVR